MRNALFVLAVATAVAHAQSPELAERLKKCVVHVEAVDRALLRAEELRRERVPVAQWEDLRIFQPYVFAASGVVVSPEGDIVTAALHPRADLRVTVSFHDGRKQDAEIVGTDPLSNLALIRVALETKDHLPIGEMAAEQGENVFLGGFARGCDAPLAMDGRVGLHELSVEIDDTYRVAGGYRIPVASAFAIVTRPADTCAGTVCVDGEGRLLGVLLGSEPPRLVPDPNRPGAHTAVQVQFATPAARVARIVRDLRAHGRVVRSNFGFEFVAVGADVRAHFDVPASACAVTRVDAGSPAAAAGLRPLDIVLSLDGRNYRDAYAFHEALSDKEPGKAVEFRVLRKGEEMALTATPSERR